MGIAAGKTLREERSSRLLEWYDRHARSLPWRIGPADRAQGLCPVPYHVWLSEIMLQQTTVAAVRSYFEKFLHRWPTVHDLARAQDQDVMAAWAGLGYYARARNLLACARVVSHDLGGVFPADRADLLKLPGIGPYTASAIAAIAFDAPETVVDGNVERVMARLFAVRTPLPAAKKELTALAESLTPVKRPGDYAQAVMDLGAMICTPGNPACGICPLSADCAARRAGIQSDLPARSPKPAKPTRFGIAYIGRRSDGAWLLERRPPKGLLGGMLGWPGSDWSEAPEPHAAPARAAWTDPGMEVRHTFTHFHLRLSLRLANLPNGTVPAIGNFIEEPSFSPSDLPTVMRKAHALARDWDGWI